MRSGLLASASVLSMTAAFVVSMTAPQEARATVFTSEWNTGSGNWNVSGNWTHTPSTTAVPNNTGGDRFDVIINRSATVDLTNVYEIDDLTLGNSAILDIRSGAALTIGNGDHITNDNQIWVANTGSASLRVDGLTNLNGDGSLTIYTGGWVQGVSGGAGTDRLTNTALHTIYLDGGRLGNNSLDVINENLIRARTGVSTIDPSWTFTNNGILEVRTSGTNNPADLILTDGTFSNGSTAQIIASGTGSSAGFLEFQDDALVSGGKITASTFGTISIDGNNASISGAEILVNNAGRFEWERGRITGGSTITVNSGGVFAGTENASTVRSQGINWQGVQADITVNSGGSIEIGSSNGLLMRGADIANQGTFDADGGSLVVESNVELSGTGTYRDIRFEATDANESFNSTDRLTIGASTVIRGNSSFQSTGDLQVVNNGSVQPGAGGSIDIHADFDNNGTVIAQGSSAAASSITITSENFANIDGSMLASGSSNHAGTITFGDDAFVSHGIITADNNGVIHLDGDEADLLAVEVTVNNGGTFKISEGSLRGGVGSLIIQSGGVLEADASSNALRSQGLDHSEIGLDVTINSGGTAHIGVNHGLLLNGADVINNGVIEGDNGTLFINGINDLSGNGRLVDTRFEAWDENGSPNFIDRLTIGASQRVEGNFFFVNNAADLQVTNEGRVQVLGGGGIATIASDFDNNNRVLAQGNSTGSAEIRISSENFQGADGIIQASGNSTNPGIITVNGSALVSSADIDIGSYSELRLDSTAATISSADIDLTGTDAKLVWNGGRLNGGLSTLDVNSGGILTSAYSSGNARNQGADAGAVSVDINVNSGGQIMLSSGTGLVVQSNTITTASSGSINGNDGYLVIDGIVNLEGNGLVDSVRFQAWDRSGDPNFADRLEIGATARLWGSTHFSAASGDLRVNNRGMIDAADGAVADSDVFITNTGLIRARGTNLGAGTVRLDGGSVSNFSGEILGTVSASGNSNNTGTIRLGGSANIVGGIIDIGSYGVLHLAGNDTEISNADLEFSGTDSTLLWQAGVVRSNSSITLNSGGVLKSNASLGTVRSLGDAMGGIAADTVINGGGSIEIGLGNALLVSGDIENNTSVDVDRGTFVLNGIIDLTGTGSFINTAFEAWDASGPNFADRLTIGEHIEIYGDSTFSEGSGLLSIFNYGDIVARDSNEQISIDAPMNNGGEIAAWANSINGGGEVDISGRVSNIAGSRAGVIYASGPNPSTRGRIHIESTAEISSGAIEARRHGTVEIDGFVSSTTVTAESFGRVEFSNNNAELNSNATLIVENSGEAQWQAGLVEGTVVIESGGDFIGITDEGSAANSGVTLGGITSRNFTINNGGEVIIAHDKALLIRSFSNIQNDGVIEFEGGTQRSSLIIDGSVNLRGTGKLDGGTGGTNQRVFGTDRGTDSNGAGQRTGDTLTNHEGHLITGNLRFDDFQGDLRLVNHGTIKNTYGDEVLELASDVTNTGLIEAWGAGSSGATIALLDGVSLNNSSGIVRADSTSFSRPGTFAIEGGAEVTGGLVEIESWGVVDIASGEIRNGTVHIMDDGELTTRASGNPNSSVLARLGGSVIIDDRSKITITENRGLALTSGTKLENNGTITLTDSQHSAPATLQIDRTVTLSGDGILQLNATNDSRAVVVSGDPSSGNDQLINSTGHTIRGAGNLGNDSVGITNRGTILANSNSDELIIDNAGNNFVSSGLVRATNSEGIFFKDNIVTNSGVMAVSSNSKLIAENATNGSTGADLVSGDTSRGTVNTHLIADGVIDFGEVRIGAGYLLGNQSTTPRSINANVFVDTVNANADAAIAPGSLLSNGTSGIGRLNIDGNYTQSADGRFLVDLNQRNGSAGFGHDFLSVTGDASLSGFLDVMVSDSLASQLQVGDTFTVLTANSLLGTPAFTIRDNYDGLNFKANYTATSVILEVINPLGSLNRLECEVRGFHAPGECAAEITATLGNGGNFGKTLIGRTRTDTLSIENTGPTVSRLDGEVIADGDGAFTNDGGTFNLAPGDVPFETEVRFTALQRGSDAAEVEVDTDIVDLDQTVTGEGVAPEASVAMLNAGFVRVGTTGAATVTVSNVGDGNEVAQQSDLLGGATRILNNLHGTVAQGSADGASGSWALAGDGIIGVDGTTGLSENANGINGAGRGGERFTVNYTPNEVGDSLITVSVNLLNGVDDQGDLRLDNQAGTIDGLLTATGAEPVFYHALSDEAPQVGGTFGTIDFGTIAANEFVDLELELSNVPSHLGLPQAITGLTVWLEWIDNAGGRFRTEGGSRFVLHDFSSDGLTRALGLRFNPKITDVATFNGSFRLYTDAGNSFLNTNGINGLGGDFTGYDFYTFNLTGTASESTAPVPLPGAMTLLGAGLVALWRQRRQTT